MSQIIVYQATRNGTDDCYIGITNNFGSRRRSHEHAARHGSTTHFHKALRKYGDGNFSWEVRAILPSRPEAEIAERLLISFERPHYNQSLGGEGASGVVHSEERREQQRQAMLGRTHTEETKLKIGVVHRGKTVSEETRGKLRVALQRRLARGEPPPNLGKPLSVETRAKISATKRAQKAAKLTAREVG